MTPAIRAAVAQSTLLALAERWELSLSQATRHVFEGVERFRNAVADPSAPDSDTVMREMTTGCFAAALEHLARVMSDEAMPSEVRARVMAQYLLMNHFQIAVLTQAVAMNQVLAEQMGER